MGLDEKVTAIDFEQARFLDRRPRTLRPTTIEVKVEDDRHARGLANA